MTESAGQASTPTQPPDFLLPRTGLQRSRHARFFLSWGGEIYGPTTEDDILAGIRASSFGENALYWHEGSDGWMPLSEFLSHGQMAAPDEWNHLEDRVAPAAPRGKTRSKRGRHPSRKEGSHPQGRRSQAPLLILGIVLLAVLLTVSILLLLMRIG